MRQPPQGFALANCLKIMAILSRISAGAHGPAGDTRSMYILAAANLFRWR